MPMIDVYSVAGRFGNKPQLTRDLNAALMRWERVPPLSMFSDNTAAFIHELAADAMANANGDNSYIRVQVLTPAGVLDRDKKLGVTKEMTDILIAASSKPTKPEQVWVQIVEAPDGGWGLGGHAYLNSEIADEARRRLTELKA